MVLNIREIKVAVVFLFSMPTVVIQAAFVGRAVKSALKEARVGSRTNPSADDRDGSWHLEHKRHFNLNPWEIHASNSLAN
jgi:hypothetical protein